ncbi:OmpA family protein [Inmirania thermothiophila]|uniref:Outer membrane protein OmpA-like peptidoglycan-associated protein n=1 Tax=Inmirania thermothiophila TaxID=1750597 RepID=A0A3N1Y431_9GAMM|nr:OmpA family protein [Inmirania thermothiophila]ROR32037.1 outer membrane protein OmpA-like peptidoglycan-associated protein [Inmirania thermothiophila]
MRAARPALVAALSLALGACATCDPNRGLKTGLVVGTLAGAATGTLVGASAAGYALAEGAAGAYLGRLRDRGAPPGRCGEGAAREPAGKEQARPSRPVEAPGVIRARPATPEEIRERLRRLREKAQEAAPAAGDDAAPPVPSGPQGVPAPPAPQGPAPEAPAEPASEAPGAGGGAVAMAESAAGSAVSASVEADAAAAAGPERTLRIRFQRDSAVLDSDSLAKLRRLAARLAQRPLLRVHITGYASGDGPGDGPEDYNHKLSHRRAEAVARVLEAAGVPRRRMILRGLGEGAPLAPEDSEAGRARNRRVEVTILEGGGVREAERRAAGVGAADG